MYHAVISALAGALMGQSPDAIPPCIDRPDFVRLRREIDHAGSASAIRALYRYAADPAHEDPVGCTSNDLEKLLEEKERKLVTLTDASKVLIPRMVAHCFKYNPITTTCQGDVEDGTGQPDYAQIRPPRTNFGPTVGRIKSLLPDARLVAVYSTGLSKVWDSNRAKLLGTSPAVNIPAGTVLIAIFTAPGPSWRYRKFVWYL